MNQKTIWIITPCYFDVKSLVRLHAEIHAKFIQPNQISQFKFVIVDDSAGMDPAMATLQSIDSNIVFTPPFNLGHQRALVYGLRKIEGRMGDDDVIISMDSDGEDRPEDMSRLYQELDRTQNSNTIVIAKRTKRTVSVNFQLMYFFYKLFFRTLTGQIIMSGNFALMNGKTLKKVIHHPFFDLCYSSTLVNLKVPTTSLPCERGNRYFDQSKMGYFNLIVHGFRMLMPFVDRISVRALISSGICTFFALAVFVGLSIAKFYMGMEISSQYLFYSVAVFMISILAVAVFLLLFTMFNQVQSLIFRKIINE